MTGDPLSEPAGRGSLLAPLRVVAFRRIWSASLLSNFGQLILGVGAAWEMTRLSGSPAMVALVQTAMMLPLMLVALPAGAIADMYDRRKVAMSGLAFAILSASALTVLALAGGLTPLAILLFCVLIGAGVALYSPAWGASVAEQVPPAALPAAISLASISYNLARSFGPAIGGIVVLVAGATAAFAANAVCYVPLLLAYYLWKRPAAPSRLPPERLDRAIAGGMRYSMHARGIRIVILRSFLFGLASVTATALAPLIARDLLKGDADLFGLLMGMGGAGAVVGAMMVGWFRAHLGTEMATRWLAPASGAAMAVAGFSTSVPVTAAAMAVIGAANMLMIAMFNTAAQLAAPRWVMARVLSLFSSALTGGIAIGAALWGLFANGFGVEIALIVSGAMLAMTALAGLVVPLEDPNEGSAETVELGHAPENALAITPRSGPVVVEVDFDVPPEQAREFHGLMQAIGRTRSRIGALDWSLARDIARPAIWTERYACATWGDYLRMRGRYTQADLDLHAGIRPLLTPGTDLVVRRKLVRPFGSVRWKADSPDPGTGPIRYDGP